MIAAWMLYTIAVTGLLFAGASAAEYLARAARAPARFVWAVAMLAALGLSGRAIARGTEPRHEVAPPVLAARSQSSKRLEITGVRTTERWTRIQPAGKIQTFVNTAREATTTVRRAANRLDVARLGVTGLNIAQFERWNAALLALCVAASCVAFIWLVGSLLNLHRIGRQLATELVDDDVVLVSNDVGPAIFGIVRSRIVLPRWVLSLPPSDRRIILTHEHQHAAAFDPALLCAAAVALALQPWNVALWMLFSRLRFALEADCDHRVLDATGDARGYGRLLVAVYERTTPRLIAHVAFVARPSDLERRIRRMTRRPRLLSMTGAVSALATLVLSTAAWTMSAPVRRAVSETPVRPRVWQLATVVVTGLRADPPPPPPKMGLITVVGAAPQATIPSPELIPSANIPVPVVRQALTHPVPVGRERVCKFGPTDSSRRPLVMRTSVDVRDATVTVDSLCMIDGEIVMLALDSSRVLVAWRDTADAGIQNTTYLVFTSPTPAVPSNLAWSTTAGHAEFAGPRFYFASPAPGIPAVVFASPASIARDQEAGALRFSIQRIDMVREPSVTWDILRQLPSAPRCKPSQQTIRVRRVGTVTPDVAPLIIVDGVVVPPDPPPPSDCFMVNGQAILLQGR